MMRLAGMDRMSTHLILKVGTSTAGRHSNLAALWDDREKVTGNRSGDLEEVIQLLQKGERDRASSERVPLIHLPAAPTQSTGTFREPREKGVPIL
jgi:hypothetical protein